MVEDKGIVIRNIFCMLAYAFKALRHERYQRVAAQTFEDVDELSAEILSRALDGIIKKGLRRDYVQKEDDLPTLRGRLDMSGTAANYCQRQQRLHCVFDEYSRDSTMNRILKSTALLLVHDGHLSKERRSRLLRQLQFFRDVGTLELGAVRWHTLVYDRNNAEYEMLMALCRLMSDRLLATTDEGRSPQEIFTDDNMARLYEHFLLEFFKHHYGHCVSVSSEVMRWDVKGGGDGRLKDLLPTMRTDMTLRGRDRILIVDAKYYGEVFQHHHDSAKLRNEHLNQIFVYAAHAQKRYGLPTAGLLLYAKTKEEGLPDGGVTMLDTTIQVSTLDLSRPFDEMKRRLRTIFEDYFPASCPGFCI